MGLEANLPDGVIMTTVDAVLNWGRENSLFPMPYATACCGIEFMSTICFGLRHWPLRR